MVEAKFTGTWLQEDVTGDVTDWLKAEGVTYQNRQTMFDANYGNGRSLLHLLFHENVAYSLPSDAQDEKEVMPLAARSAHILDGVSRPSIEADGAPFIPVRSYTITGQLAGEVVELTAYGEDGKVNYTMRRFLSEDAEMMTDELLYCPESAKPFSIKVVYKKQDKENPLTVEKCISWCPRGLVLGPATSPQAVHKQAVFCGPLEEDFPSVSDFMEYFDKASPTFAASCFFKAHSGPPLRVECWSNEADETEAMVAAMEAILHVMDAIYLYHWAHTSIEHMHTSTSTKF